MAYTNLKTAIEKLNEVDYGSKNFDNFRENLEWIIAAIKLNKVAIFDFSSSKKLLEDEDTVRLLASIDGRVLSYAPNEFKDNKEIAITAFESGRYICLDMFSDELRCDKEVVLASVSKWGSNLKFASEELRCDKEVVLVAIRSAPSAEFDMSLGLKVLCKGKDPIVALEAEIKREEAEKLGLELSKTNESPQPRKMKL